jgi:pimeloyl-ACP methyl ester carboxylesterase
MPFISLNDHKHFFLAKGKGHTIILLHGALLDHSMWQFQIDFFSRYYRVIVYDLRGHGKSRDGNQDFDIALLAEDLKSLIHAFGIEKPIICGLSLGGLVAQVYASKYPQRLKKLILADTAATLFYSRFQTFLFKFFLPESLNKILIFVLGVKGFTKMSLNLASLISGKSWLSPQQTTRTYIKNQMLHHSKSSFYRVIQSILGFKKQDIHKISCPTLLINGEQEHELILKQRDLFRKELKNLAEAIIPDAGHIPPMDNPALFNKTVYNFIKEK